MIYELIYTSYPKGLQTGSSGFTTVACTESMPRNYILLCESLSGYQYAYPLNTPLYDQNPVAFSHYSYTLGDRKISILSRISAFGKDYTGRENKLAHHVLVDSGDRTSGGPAWAMIQGDFFVNNWDQDPHRLPQGRIHLPDGEPGSYTAQNWINVFGNAKPAAALARSVLINPRMPSFIIFKPGMSVLQLMTEVLFLIPPEKRWDITFNTYFSTKPIDAECQWRCCLQGSDALEAAKKYPGAIIVDIPNRSLSGTIPDHEELLPSAQHGAPPPWLLARQKSTMTIQPPESETPFDDDVEPISEGVEASHLNLHALPEHPPKSFLKYGLLWAGIFLFVLFLLIFFAFFTDFNFTKIINKKTSPANQRKISHISQPDDIKKRSGVGPERLHPSPSLPVETTLPDQSGINHSKLETKSRGKKTTQIREIPKSSKHAPTVLAYQEDMKLPLGEYDKKFENLSGIFFTRFGKMISFSLEKQEDEIQKSCKANVMLANGNSFGNIQCDALTMRLPGDYKDKYAAMYFSDPDLMIWINPFYLKLSKRSASEKKYAFRVDLMSIDQTGFNDDCFKFKRQDLSGTLKYDNFPNTKLDCSAVNKGWIDFRLSDNGQQLEKQLEVSKERYAILDQIIKNIESITPDKTITPGQASQKLESILNEISKAKAFSPSLKPELNKLENTKNIINLLTADSFKQKFIDERNRLAKIKARLTDIRTFFTSPGAIFPEDVTIYIYYQNSAIKERITLFTLE